MPTLAVNKFARKDYFIQDTLESGIKLTGAEVKSVKKGNIDMKGSYVSIDNDLQVWLVGCYIAPYKPAQKQQENYDPNRKKQLLLHKKQIHHLIGRSKEQGLTILPLSVYTKGSFIKLELGIGRGKKKQDKRETIKKRQLDREIRATLRQKR